MVVTRNEVERSKNVQIETINSELAASQDENRALNELLTDHNLIKEKNRNLESENARITAERDILDSRIQRLEIDNKRLREE